MGLSFKKDKELSTKKQISSDHTSGKQSPLIDIERDLFWLQGLCKTAINVLTANENSSSLSKETIAKVLNEIPEVNGKSEYHNFFRKNYINSVERIVILLSIAPYFSAKILSPLSLLNARTNNFFLEVGGIIDNNNKEFTPTIDTVRFLTTGGLIHNFYIVDEFLKGSSRLLKQNIIRTYNQNGDTLWNKQIIRPTDEFMALICGEKYEPSYSSNFPATKINTKLDWEDLVLPYDTHLELKEPSIWLKHSQAILSHPELKRIIKPGYRCLFYGPPGTGKTLTASLLGKLTGLDVYRIDLSMVVSKWVGETEKNLKGIFDQAENKNWILFFDEADSLFGKRTQTKSSNDRYANQEIAYLLQRIEDFPGLVILATNMKDNIDEAFNRRFQSMVYFPNPDAENRYVLWKNSIPSDFLLENSVDLYELADKYEISGGIIINIIRYCILMALNEDRKIIHEEDIEKGIMKELKKSGKIVG